MTGPLNNIVQTVGQRCIAARDRLLASYHATDTAFQTTWHQRTGRVNNVATGLMANTGVRLTRLHKQAQRIPLVYKLSMLITVLVVTCMTLLGSIIVQQQTRLFENQIHEQGTTLARLMAKSAKEPLLAEDQLALDVITTGFTNNSSISGTAIITLEGNTIAHAGGYHNGEHQSQINALNRLMEQVPGSLMWTWPGTASTTGKQVISFVEPVIFQGVTAGYTMVTISRAGMEASLRSAKQAIAGATLLIIFLGIAMSFVIGKRITGPIDLLVDASHAIAKGDYDIRFKERRSDELGQLMDAFDEMAEGLLEKSRVKDALSRYVSPGVAREILANLDDVELGGKRIEATVIFADIVGFTPIAENIKPEDLVSILNRYFSLITRACEANNGIVDKYMGDGAMLVFGAPQPDENHRFNAIACALLIQKLIEQENADRGQQGLFPIQFRIGINSGTMLAGNLGSRERMEYTVVGDVVNMASRLCGITNSGQIVISRNLYMFPDVQERVLAGEYQSIRLRGIKEPVSTYLVECLTADWQNVIDEQLNTVSMQDEYEDA